MTATLSEPPLFGHLGDPWYVADLLSQPGTVCTGHFRLLGGEHSDRFVRFSSVAKDRDALNRVADLLASAVAPAGSAAVVAPCTAGVALGVELARRLGVRLHLASVDGAGRADGYVEEPPAVGSSVLIVNDVVTTGQGLRALAHVVADARAEVAAAAAFLSRTLSIEQQLTEFPLALIATVPFASWSPAECPLCFHGEPVTDGLDLN